MDLQLKKSLFIITGASSGLGNAIAKSLAQEGAKVIAVARRGEKLLQLEIEFHDNIEVIVGDILETSTQAKIMKLVDGRKISGVLLNAGGPPATSALETTMPEWDNAYKQVFRWKVEFLNKLLPLMLPNTYGRILFIESFSVKQPVPNLAMSNAMRMAVVGYAKTLANEIASKGLTVNIIAPGFHKTDAIKRVITKQSQTQGIAYDEAYAKSTGQIPVGFMGDAADLASFATWLFSPYSRYITGQTFVLDGGVIKSTF